MNKSKIFGGGLLSRRMIMNILENKGGNNMLDYGTFNVVNPKYPSWKYWQVSTEDNKIEVDLGKLTFVPKRILAVYDDDVNDYYYANNAATIFYANESSNGYSYLENGNSFAENKSFKESDAIYIRYSVEEKRLYLHVRQWANIKCGKWRWIAIGELEDD